MTKKKTIDLNLIKTLINMAEAFLTVGGAWLNMWLYGLSLCWGSMKPYIASYYHMIDPRVSEDDFFIVNPSIVLLSMFTFPIGVSLTNSKGPKM